jgi:hypothetical protein
MRSGANPARRGDRRNSAGDAGRECWLREWIGGEVEEKWKILSLGQGGSCAASKRMLMIIRLKSFREVNPVAVAKHILLSGILLVSQPATIKEARAQDRCQAAIAGVKQDIQGRIGAVVNRIERVRTAEWRGDGDFMQTYKSPFRNADEIVVFNLASDMGRGSITRKQGQAAEDIMNSSQLTQKYAQRIISACEPVASVKFFYWEWFQGWSLHRNNELLEDKCKNPDGSKYYWGENICV